MLKTMRSLRLPGLAVLGVLSASPPAQHSKAQAFLLPSSPLPADANHFGSYATGSRRRLLSRSAVVTIPPEQQHWDTLSRLIEEAQGDQVNSLGISPRAPDKEMVSYLDKLKDGGLLSAWNSTRLSQYRVSKSDVRIYTKMAEDIEKTLGFTSSPVIERIESGLAIVMAFTFGSSVLALDKFPGPDIVRWCATALLVSTPFIYISLGLSLPDTLTKGIDSVLFLVNKDYKERLYRHEAGHFLVGYMCGLPVLDYDVGARLSAVKFAKAFQQDDDNEEDELPGPLPRALAMQQQFVEPKLFTEDDMNKLTVVSLAGVVSEYIRFGAAEGGYNDLLQLTVLMDLQNPEISQREAEEQVNWGALMAYSILKSNEQAVNALIAAFERGASVVECIQIIEGEV